MISARLFGIRDLRLAEEPVPVAKHGEVHLQVTSVGICDSDIHWFTQGTTGTAEFGQLFVLGHEFAGVVADGEMAGTRVAVEPTISCGQCELCIEGNPNLCPSHIFAGQPLQDGALRQFLVWPKKYIHPIPDIISDGAAALLEPLGVAFHTADLGKLRTGMRVGVYGCGPIGLLVVQLSRLSGAAEILATDKSEHRLDAALQMGATEVFQAEKGQEIIPFMAAIANRGVDVAFEVASDQGAVETAVKSCRPGGLVVICGIPSYDRTSFRASTSSCKGLTIKIVRRMKHTYPRAIRLVETGMIDLESLITHRFPLEQCLEAFKFAESRRGLKVTVDL